MKKFLFPLVFLFSFFLSANDPALIPYLKGEKWGFADPSRKVVIECIYDEVKPFAGGLAAVSMNGKWGFIDAKGKVVVGTEFDDAEDFKKGWTAVKKNSDWFIINEKGKILFDKKFSKVDLLSSNGSTNKFYLATCPGDTLVYLLNENAKIISRALDFEYFWDTPGILEFSKVTDFKSDSEYTELYGVIDIEGKIILPAEFSDVKIKFFRQFENDPEVSKKLKEFRKQNKNAWSYLKDKIVFIVSGKDGKKGVYLPEKSKIISPVYSELDEYLLLSEKIVSAQRGQKEIFLNLNFNLKDSVVADTIYYPEKKEKLYAYASGNNLGFFNKTGKIISPKDFKGTVLRKNFAMGKNKDSVFCLITENKCMELKRNLSYGDDKVLDDYGWVGCGYDGFTGLLFNDGHFSKKQYWSENFLLTKEKAYISKDGKKFGVIDKKENELLPFIFDEVICDAGEKYLVRNGESLFIADKKKPELVYKLSPGDSVSNYYVKADKGTFYLWLTTKSGTGLIKFSGNKSEKMLDFSYQTDFMVMSECPLKSDSDKVMILQDTSGKFALFSTTGKMLLPFDYTEMQDMRWLNSPNYNAMGVLTRDANGNAALFNYDGSFAIPSGLFKEIYYSGSNGENFTYDAVQADDKFSILKNPKGKGFFPQYFKFLEMVSSNHILAIDSNGNSAVLNSAYLPAFKFHPFTVSNTEPMGSYDDKIYFTCGKNGLSGVIDQNNNLIIPVKYSEIFIEDQTSLHQNFIVKDQEGKFGAYNSSGVQLVQCLYSEYLYTDGAVLNFKDEKGNTAAYDAYGKLLLKPKYAVDYPGSEFFIGGKSYINIEIIISENGDAKSVYSDVEGNLFMENPPK